MTVPESCIAQRYQIAPRNQDSPALSACVVSGGRVESIDRSDEHQNSTLRCPIFLPYHGGLPRCRSGVCGIVMKVMITVRVVEDGAFDFRHLRDVIGSNYCSYCCRIVTS